MTSSLRILKFHNHLDQNRRCHSSEINTSPFNRCRHWPEFRPSRAFLFLARECLARYMLSPVRLSICLSHGWITQKRLMLGWWNFHRTVALSVQFFGGKFYPEMLTGSPERGRQTKEEWENKPFSSFKYQYLENGRR